MNSITTAACCLLAAGFLSIPAAAQQASQSQPKARQVDLNEFVVKGNGLKTIRKKVRTGHHMMHFDVVEVGNPRPWDSSYWLTRFPAPTDKTFLLSSVEGRIADFDTANFEMYLTVVQINGGDTLFRTSPVAPAADQKRRGHWRRMALRDSGILLQPAPFYLGYGFHTKPVTKAFMYRLYAAHTGEGEGVKLRIHDGKWSFTSYPDMTVFPFRIAYLEL